MQKYTSLFLLVVLLHLSAAGLANAQTRSHNSFIAGDIEKLVNLKDTIKDIPCSDLACSINIRPLRFTVDLRDQSGMQVTLIRAEHARNVVQGDQKSGLEAPLLFRGIVRLRNSSESRSRKAYPASAVIRGPARNKRFELFLPRKSRGGGGGSGDPTSRLIRVKTYLPKSDFTAKLLSHAEFVSSHAFQDVQCAHARKSSTNPISSSRLQPLKNEKLLDATALKRLWIATDTDAELDTLLGNNANDEILSLVNAASALYEAQLGSSISVLKQRRSSDGVSSPPYTSTTAETLLTQFRNYVTLTSRLGDADSYILFSGKHIDSSVIGIAYTGATCVDQSYSFVMNQYISGTINPIILAHESGHGLGSPHFDLVLEIMNTSLGNRLPATFSTDSQGVIVNHLQRYYDNGCLGAAGGGGGITTPKPGLTPSVTPQTPTPAGNQPLPAPSATPIQKGGSGNLPGSPGSAEIPTTLLMQTRLGKNGSLSFSFSSLNYKSGCLIGLTAGKTSTAARSSSALPVGEFDPLGQQSAVDARIPFAISNRTMTDKSLVFYASTLRCNGAVVEQSVSRKTDPSKVRGRSVSRTTYLRQLPDLLSGAVVSSGD